MGQKSKCAETKPSVVKLLLLDTWSTVIQQAVMPTRHLWRRILDLRNGHFHMPFTLDRYACNCILNMILLCFHDMVTRNNEQR